MQTEQYTEDLQQNSETEAERRRRRQKMIQQREAEKKRRQDLIVAAVFIFVCALTVIILSAVTGKDEEAVPSSTPAGSHESRIEKTSAETETEHKPSEKETDGPSESETESLTEETEPVPTEPNSVVDASAIVIPSWVSQDFLTVSEWNRPGILMPQPVKNIVIHYVANPGSTAKGNRDYFEDLARTQERSASAHFVVGLQGEIIQCIPLTEMAYANAPRNEDTISVEVCHPDASGQFSETTYWTLVRFTSWLLEQYHMTSEELIRHYDCNGKPCPLYYVENPDAWERLKADVADYMNEHPDIANELP